MTIKGIIQKLYTAITDACLQESNFESWLILNDGIIDAIDALKALDEQEPVAWEQFYPDIGKPKFVAQPEKEPVAWMFQHEETGRTVCIDAQQLGWGFEKGNPRLKKIAPLYTIPPQPTQVKLTDDEIWKFWWARPEIPEGENDSMEAEFVAAVRAVLAAYGIKE